MRDFDGKFGLCSDDDVVDGDVDQLHEEPDEPHDGEPDGRCDRDLLEFWGTKKQKFK